MVGKGRILVVDDENIVRHVAQRMLRKLQYECEVVNDGASAIEAYAKAAQSQKPYDAVIIDLKLTGSLDGSQTFKKLQALNPQIKAIVSSGYTFDPVILNYHKHGFKGAVTKPYRIDDLEATLSEVFIDIPGEIEVGQEAEILRNKIPYKKSTFFSNTSHGESREYTEK